MKTKFLLLICLMLMGCDWTKKQVGLGPSPEEIRKQKEDEARLVKSSDDLVSTWTNRLENRKNSDGTFDQHEGVTEEDSWGNFIKVEYKDEKTKEILSVSSAGPDGVFGTGDDLIRRREAEKNLGLLGLIAVNLAPYTTIILVWLSAGILVWLSSLKFQSLRKRRGHKPVPQLLVFLGCILAAPFAALALLVLSIGSLASGDIELPDIDIDL